MSKLTEAQKLEICERYQKGESGEYLAKVFYVLKGTIYYWLKNFNIPRRSDSISHTGKKLSYSPWNKGKIHTQSKNSGSFDSERLKGSKNHMWQGGKKLWVARQNHRRRQINKFSIFLNKSSEGSVGHHWNKTDILYIPEELHKSIPHSLIRNEHMEQINQLALEWYFDQNILNNRFNLEGDI